MPCSILIQLSFFFLSFWFWDFGLDSGTNRNNKHGTIESTVNSRSLTKLATEEDRTYTKWSGQWNKQAQQTWKTIEATVNPRFLTKLAIEEDRTYTHTPNPTNPVRHTHSDLYNLSTSGQHHKRAGLIPDFISGNGVCLGRAQPQRESSHNPLGLLGMDVSVEHPSLLGRGGGSFSTSISATLQHFTTFQENRKPYISNNRQTTHQLQLKIHEQTQTQPTELAQFSLLSLYLFSNFPSFILSDRLSIS